MVATDPVAAERFGGPLTLWRPVASGCYDPPTGSRMIEIEERTMIARVRQSGEGKLGCIVWVLLFTIATMAAVKMIPIRVAVGELTDYASEQAKWAGGSESDAIKNRLYNKARQLDLPLSKEQITVEKRAGKIRIAMNFTVPVEFPGYTYDWNFDIDREWDIFIF